MNNTSSETVQSITPGVEAYEWIRTSNLSELVANFARVHILVSLFDGDPGKWIDFILRDGTAEERAHDLPFVQQVQRRLASDPGFIQEMRRLVREFSTLFAPARLSNS